MPLVPAKSSQYADYTASPRVMVKPQDWGAKLARSTGKLTFTAAGQGTAQLVRMPPGKVIVLPDLCRIVCPAGTAGALLDIGHGAYVNAAGVTVVADPAHFQVDLANTAAIDAVWTLPADGEEEFESQDGFDITVTIDTQNSAAAGDLYVSVVYAIGR